MRLLFKSRFTAGLLLIIAILFLGLVGCIESVVPVQDSSVIIAKVSARTIGWGLVQKYPEAKPVAQAFCSKLLNTEDEAQANALLALGISYLNTNYASDTLIIANLNDLLAAVNFSPGGGDIPNLDLDTINALAGAFCEGVSLGK